MIILNMDFNDPVQRHDITTFFDKFHIKVAILTIHIGNSPPVTNMLNES